MVPTDVVVAYRKLRTVPSNTDVVFAKVMTMGKK